MIHDIHLQFTRADDGVHLICSCGGDIVLGRDAKKIDHNRAIIQHLVDNAEKDRMHVE